MLTFILVVVLGGGVALLAISLAETDQPATDPPEPDRGDPLAEASTAPVPEPEPEPEPALDPEPELAPEPEPQLVAVPAAAELPRRLGHEPVPAQFTAVEGRYADVAIAPAWRRVLALVGIIVITVTFGVAFAAVLGAIIAAVAEVLSNAIG